MGIEIEAEYGGSDMNFTSVIVAVEELAKIDPSVSVSCDVQVSFIHTHLLLVSPAMLVIFQICYYFLQLYRLSLFAVVFIAVFRTRWSILFSVNMAQKS
jgi:hypothetical protein